MSSELASCLYEGTVRHRRRAPTEHALRRCPGQDDLPTAVPARPLPRQRAIQGLRQPQAEGVIPRLRLAHAHQADAALKDFVQLLAKVVHQMSSPSRLICS